VPAKADVNLQISWFPPVSFFAHFWPCRHCWPRCPTRFDPKLGDIAGELDNLYDETADEGDPDPISLPPEMPEPAW